MNYKKIIFIVGFLALAGFIFNFGGQNAKAMTASEIQNLIQSLQQQIAELQQQVPTTETATVWCHDFNTNLKYGDTGSEVEDLKIALTKEGTWPRQDGINNEFDEETASYVVSFQEKYKSEILTPSGLKNGTGFVGKSTRAKLNKLYGCKITESPTTPSITVLSPNGGETWVVGQTYTIKWSSNNLNSSKLLEISLQRKLSTDNQYWDVRTIANMQSQNGSYQWLIPNDLITSNTLYKILIKEMGKSGLEKTDASDSYFSIAVKDTSDTSCEDLGCSYLTTNRLSTLQKYDTDKNGQMSLSENLASINSYKFGDTTKDEFCAVQNAWEKSCTFTATPVTCTDSDGGKNYNVKGCAATSDSPNSQNCDSCSLETATGVQTLYENYCDGGVVKYEAYTQCSYGCSLGACKSPPVSIPSITITSPQTGETITAGSQINIQWTAEDIDYSNAEGFQVYYLQQGSSVWNFVGATTVSSSNSYAWTVPDITGKINLWVGAVKASKFVYQESLDGVNVVSSKIDNIPSTPSVAVLSPNGGETWTAGNTYQIKWNSTGITEKISSIQLSYRNSASSPFVEDVIASQIDNTGTYNWAIPASYGTGKDQNFFKIRVVYSGAIGDYSDNYFAIVAPTVSCATAVTCAFGFTRVQTGTDSSGCPVYTCQTSTTTNEGSGTWTPSGTNVIENQLADISRAVSRLIEEIAKMSGR